MTSPPEPCHEQLLALGGVSRHEPYLVICRDDEGGMNAGLTVSIISAVVALASVLLSARAARSNDDEKNYAVKCTLFVIA
jgi:hypothetical protein